jgi:bifunctional UDP-N-acetylglucosamine pyrophosphorylase/glucosamine-1-phosphate N-acetyltransferase
MGESLTVVVLAAGEGKRFRSALPKPLHPVAGRPLLWHVLAAAAPLKADRTVVVVGNGADQVTEAVDGLRPGPGLLRRPGRPAGHRRRPGHRRAAAGGRRRRAGPVRRHPAGLGRAAGGLLDAHRSARATATLLTCTLADPTGYGRILRDPEGAVTGMVEERDATPGPAPAPRGRRRHVRVPPPRPRRPGALRPDNDQGEYYLPDLVPQVLAGGGRVATAEGPGRRPGGSTTGSSWPRPRRCCAAGCWSG